MKADTITNIAQVFTTLMVLFVVLVHGACSYASTRVVDGTKSSLNGSYYSDGGKAYVTVTSQCRRGP